MNRPWSRSGCLATLIALVLLLAGCQSAGTSGSRTVFSKSRIAEDDPDLNRRVEAMAAFSTGIVLTERDEPEAAYEQFARAAEKDPTNEAIAIDIDLPRWRAGFEALWPAGSDAHVSYFDRILRGPDYAAGDAVRPLA